MRPRKPRVRFSLLVCTSAFLLGATPVHGFDVETTPSASVRHSASLLRWPTKGPLLPEGYLGVNETRVRPALKVERGDQVSLSVAMESRAGFATSALVSGSASEQGGSILGAVQPLRYFDWTWHNIKDPAAYLITTIERADVFVHTGPIDFDLGRQPVSFGSSRFVGVVDVIAPFAPGDLDNTYKPGVDAVRARTGFGESTEAEIVAVAAVPVKNGALVGRLRTSVFGFDVEGLGGRFRQRNFGGFTWDGDAGFAGWWGEAALFQRESEPRLAGWSKAAFSGVTGLERSFGDFMLGAGVYYHDFGARRPADIAKALNGAPFQQGWEFLPSAAYGVTTLQWQAHPLVQLSAAGLVALTDASSLWQPRAVFSVSDNADVTAYAWISAGPAPYLTAGRGLVPPDLNVPSDFGRVPDGGGIYARWFL